MESPRVIFRFRNGIEATSVSQLAEQLDELMIKNPRDAVEALYGEHIEYSLAAAGEDEFSEVARTVVTQYPHDEQFGVSAMVQMVRRKMRFDKGGEAATPEDIARRIDPNWEQGKGYLYNGFMALWLEHVGQPKLAMAAKGIAQKQSDRDIGLEQFVQQLDPQLGQPKLEVLAPRANLGEVDVEKIAEGVITIEFTIHNTARGHLYGTIRAPNSSIILDENTFSSNGVKIQGTVRRVERNISVMVDSNGGRTTIPITMKPVLTTAKGDIIRTCTDLFCYDVNWSDGKRQLYGGHLVALLAFLGESDLVQSIREIVDTEQDPETEDQDIGLEKFMQCLNVEPPRMVVDTTQIDIGRKAATIQLTIRNIGRGHLYGKVVGAGEWVVVDTSDFSGNTKTITADLQAVGIAGLIRVESNSGVKNLPIKINPPVPFWRKIFNKIKGLFIKSTADFPNS